MNPARARFMYQLTTHGYQIDCDTLTDDALSGMEYKGFVFKILNGNKCL